MNHKKQVVTGLVLIVLSGLLFPLYAREKLAQTGMQFLSIGTDARAAGLGEATATLDMKSTSLFFNPAGMANLGGLADVAFSQISWIADIKINSFSMAFNPANGIYGVFGLSFAYANYGEIEGTMVYPNSNGYIDTEVYKPNAMSIGIGYARALSDKFSIGGHFKIVNEYLGKSVVPDQDGGYKVKRNLADAVAFDFGTTFKTGYKNLIVAMMVRNFSNETKYEDEGFQLPLTFKLGISANLFEFIAQENFQQQSLFFAIDGVHPRDHSEQLNLGLEYGYLKTFYARMGYMLNYDECGISFGCGIRKFGIAIDYGYTPYGVFENVQRISFGFSY